MTLMFLMHSALYAVNLVLMSPQNVKQNDIDMACVAVTKLDNFKRKSL